MYYVNRLAGITVDLNLIYVLIISCINKAAPMIEKRSQIDRDTKTAFPMRSNCLKCNWEGSSENITECPLCGYNTYRTQTLKTGCTTIFKFKNNLIIKDRLYQQGIVRIEEADCADLAEYITTVILEKETGKTANAHVLYIEQDKKRKKWNNGVLSLKNVYKNTADN